MAFLTALAFVRSSVLSNPKDLVKFFRARAGPRDNKDARRFQIDLRRLSFQPSDSGATRKCTVEKHEFHLMQACPLVTSRRPRDARSVNIVGKTMDFFSAFLLPHLRPPVTPCPPRKAVYARPENIETVLCHFSAHTIPLFSLKDHAFRRVHFHVTRRRNTVLSRRIRMKPDYYAPRQLQAGDRKIRPLPATDVEMYDA